MDVEVAIAKLERYITENYPPPKISWCKNDFDTRCYERWASNEILDRLINETYKLPPHISGDIPIGILEITENFLGDMEYFHDVSGDVKNKIIFSIAAYTASEIYNFMKGEVND